MAKKLTTVELRQRLIDRNNLYRDRPVLLYPKTQRYQGQTKPMTFRCSANHTWIGTAERVIFRGGGCPECKRSNERLNKRLPWKTLEHQMLQAHPHDNYTYDANTYHNTYTKMSAICTLHGMFSIIPNRHKSGKNKCPKCKSIDRDCNFVKKATKLHAGFYVYDTTTDIDRTKMTIICPTHGSFTQNRGDHLKGHGCSSCVNGRVSRKQIFWLTQLAESEKIEIDHAGNVGEYAIPNTKYKADGYHRDSNTIYEFHGDAFHGNPNRYQPDVHCHPFKKHLTASDLYTQTMNKEAIIKSEGYNLVVMWESTFDSMYPSFTVTDAPNIQKGSALTYINHQLPSKLLMRLQLSLMDKTFNGFKHKHTFRCLLCGSSFNTTLTQRKQANRLYGSVGCTQCSANKKTSKTINEIHKLIGGKVVGRVIDLPSGGVTIIPLVANSRLDLIKTQQAFTERTGQNLCVVFEDEWVANPLMVVNKLKHYTNSNSNTRVHARQCTIQTIKTTTKSTFLNNYHIQGSDAANIKYGAYYKSELIAVMTFTKPRVALGYKGENVGGWELSRFATHSDYRIPGIASKLLTHFKRNEDWQKIISYADRRWSTGNMYATLGFTLEHTNSPSYHYVIDGVRKHRWNYRKDMLKNTLENYDAALTEYQNMVNAGFWRVWDCGTMRYVLTNSNW